MLDFRTNFVVLSRLMSFTERLRRLLSTSSVAVVLVDKEGYGFPLYPLHEEFICKPKCGTIPLSTCDKLLPVNET